MVRVPHVMRSAWRFAALLGMLAFFAGMASAQKPAHWVGTWAASPQTPPMAAQASNSTDAGFNNQTIRMVARVSVGGDEVRVRFSNAFGSAPMTLGEAHLALAGKGAAVVAGTDRTLTFSEGKSFIIPPGAMVISDPVHLNVPPLTSVAVSVFIPEGAGPATWHSLGRQTTYISGPGNFTASADMPVAKTATSWYWLSGIEVLASKKTGAVVALGDSITDGAAATVDENRRWPDVLAEQLVKQKESLAVLNEGISGNRLLHDVVGSNALARFDRDVLGQAGVRYLIVLEGINDIGWPHFPASFRQEGNFTPDAVTAEQIIAALGQIAERAHAHGIRVFCATLTPFGGAFYETADGEAEREAVNKWIRTSGAFDGVIDFDQVTRDPKQLERFLPAYDSGDHLHPGDAGYDAMGRAAAEALRRATRGRENQN